MSMSWSWLIMFLRWEPLFVDWLTGCSMSPASNLLHSFSNILLNIMPKYCTFTVWSWFIISYLRHLVHFLLSFKTYDNDVDSSTTTRNSDVDSPLSSRLPFFQRLFCCGRRALSSKQYGGSYKGEDFGVASVGEKEGVRNKLQSCR